VPVNPASADGAKSNVAAKAKKRILISPPALARSGTLSRQHPLATSAQRHRRLVLTAHDQIAEFATHAGQRRYGPHARLQFGLHARQDVDRRATRATAIGEDSRPRTPYQPRYVRVGPFWAQQACGLVEGGHAHECITWRVKATRCGFVDGT